MGDAAGLELPDDTCRLIWQFVKAQTGKATFAAITSSPPTGLVGLAGSRAAIARHLSDHLVGRGFVTRGEVGAKVCYAVREEQSRPTVATYPIRVTGFDLALQVEPDSAAPVHHEVTYHLVNQSAAPEETFYVKTWGDVGRTWRELHPKVSELRGGSEQVLYDAARKPSFERETPETKNFIVRFATPLYPGERLSIRFAYDWEEPHRSWDYSAPIAPHPIKFRLQFIDGADHTLRVEFIEPMTRRRELSPISPHCRRIGKKTTWNWECPNPRSTQSILFTWT